MAAAFAFLPQGAEAGALSCAWENAKNVAKDPKGSYQNGCALPGGTQCDSYAGCKNADQTPPGMPCPDGTISTGSCPEVTNCGGGKTVPKGQPCPEELTKCSDGSSVPKGTACPGTKICSNGKVVPVGTSCEVTICSNGTAVNPGETCPPGPGECLGGIYNNLTGTCSCPNGKPPVNGRCGSKEQQTSDSGGTTAACSTSPKQCSGSEVPVESGGCWTCGELAPEDQEDVGLAKQYPDLFKQDAIAFEPSTDGKANDETAGKDLGLDEIPGWEGAEAAGCAAGGKCSYTAKEHSTGDEKLKLSGLENAGKGFQNRVGDELEETFGGFQLASLILAPREGGGSGLNRRPGGLTGWTEPEEHGDLPDPQGPAALLRSALDLMREENWEAARKLLEAARNLDPNNPKILGNLAKTLNRLHRWDEAVLRAVEAHRLAPNDPLPLQEYAWAQLHLGDAKQALDAARRAIKLDPKDAWSRVLAALAYEVLGDRANMIRELEEAARLDPKYQGHLDRARAGLKLFDPKNSDILFRDLGDAGLNDANPFGRAERAGKADARDDEKSFRSRALRAAKSRKTWGGLVLALIGAAFYLWPSLARKLRGAKVVIPDDAPSLAAALAPEPEDMRVGRYELLRVVSEGALGKVWEARDTGLGREISVTQVAVTGGPGGSARRAAVLAETRRLASLQHPDIVPLLDVVDVPRGVFLAYEAAKGRTLEQVLSQSKGMTLAGAHRMLAPVCAALEYAHSKGVTHRDISPANVLVSEDGKVRLAGFGLGKVTPGPFSAPELAQGLATPLSDVYSLGVCLSRMLAGASPEAGQLVAAATRPALEERLRSPGEFLAELEKLLPALKGVS